ncbi:death-associated inhibitor of apoptosis 1 [Anabrus simplex]|uniref:death-associated inhibitor of apoptosis 1 n=1 Tax=Anabrus simplex TaxID=316456 RepID=UPI0034DD0221
MAPDGTGTSSQLVKENAASAGSDEVDRTTLNLKSEADRCTTFRTWPVSFLAPDRLAAAGFYYLRKEDIVQCVFCGVEIGRWEEGDDPFRDHLKWSPACPYLRKIPVGNIPLDPNDPPIVPESNSVRGCDTCGPQGLGMLPNTMLQNGDGKLDEQAAALEKLGIHKSKGPIYTKYSSIEGRLRSYENIWPVSMKQRPDKLSEAGFFYTGKGDQTVCFHCGGALKDWKNGDDPFVEHALWYPKCTYIVQLKGKEFVDKISGEKEALIAAKEANDIEVPSELKEAVQIHHPEEKESSPLAPHSVEDTASKVVHEERLCKICYQEEMGVVFLPCGHLVACVKCALSLNTCAVCRKPVSATVRTFLS